jgi:hypothetical protein
VNKTNTLLQEGQSPVEQGNPKNTGTGVSEIYSTIILSVLNYKHAKYTKMPLRFDSSAIFSGMRGAEVTSPSIHYHPLEK